MAIDITNQEAIRKLTLENLIADAAERKDKPAFDWLQEQVKSTVERTQENGKVITVAKPLISIRAEYLRKFLNYNPNANKGNSAAAKAKAKAKREKEINDMFGKYADAFN